MSGLFVKVSPLSLSLLRRHSHTNTRTCHLSLSHTHTHTHTNSLSLARSLIFPLPASLHHNFHLPSPFYQPSFTSIMLPLIYSRLLSLSLSLSSLKQAHTHTHSQTLSSVHVHTHILTRTACGSNENHNDAKVLEQFLSSTAAWVEMTLNGDIEFLFACLCLG